MELSKSPSCYSHKSRNSIGVQHAAPLQCNQKIILCPCREMTLHASCVKLSETATRGFGVIFAAATLTGIWHHYNGEMRKSTFAQA